MKPRNAQLQLPSEASGTPADEREFGLLVTQYQPGLLKYATRILGIREADAWDLLQDALQKAWVGKVHRQGAGAWRAWMSTVILNGLKSRHRRQRAETHRCSALQWLARLFEDSEAAPVPGLWRFISDEDLRRETARLKPHLRDVYVLHAQGLSYARIGERLGLNPGTVGSYLTAARKQLQKQLRPVAEQHRQSAGDSGL
ncbi:MAG TPA: RNA polymerase sigma factor [Myxococcus sp.]|jgi:RNA polymerase sigma-70 factor (ECF subfamily)|nr:RNA polymerase sigma factor [Myxococcus sp.]